MSDQHARCPQCGGAVTIREGSTMSGIGYAAICYNHVKGTCSYKGTAYYGTKALAYHSWDTWSKELKPDGV